jgi:imidazolonepropionase-like amidohydrolase
MPLVRGILVLAIVATGGRSAAQAPEPVAVLGDLVHTMAGPPLPAGLVLVEAGRIVAVGRQAEIQIPQGARVLRAAVVTPGLIDARSVVGLSGLLNQKQDQDQLDPSQPVQPELRAVDAFHLEDPLVAYLRGLGVTLLHTGHAPGALVSGQTMVVKTAAPGASPRVLVEELGVAATLGPTAFGADRKRPGTRGSQAALLRAELVRAREYAEKRGRAGAEPPPRDLRLEVLSRVLSGELPLIVAAQRAQDIRTALRLASEFGFRLWLDGGAESYLLIEELRAAGVPVLVHPPMARATGELANATFRLAAILDEAGVRWAFQAGYESYVPKSRVVLFEAAAAVGHGLDAGRALRGLTLEAATLLGVEARVGSLEPGKDADMALFDGDPFEWTTRCLGTLVDGVPYPGEDSGR